MEMFGVNILNSEECCSDIVALFFNHLFECDECFIKVFGYFVYFVLAIAVIFFVISCFCDFICKGFSKLFDRFRYKKLYDDLITKHGDLLEEYDSVKAQNESLMSQWHELNLKYDELKKEYYHTCN